MCGEWRMDLTPIYSEWKYKKRIESRWKDCCGFLNDCMCVYCSVNSILYCWFSVWTLLSKEDLEEIKYNSCSWWDYSSNWKWRTDTDSIILLYRWCCASTGIRSRAEGKCSLWSITIITKSCIKLIMSVHIMIMMNRMQYHHIAYASKNINTLTLCKLW